MPDVMGGGKLPENCTDFGKMCTMYKIVIF